MVDVADNHQKTLDIKQRFIFIFVYRGIDARITLKPSGDKDHDKKNLPEEVFSMRKG